MGGNEIDARPRPPSPVTEDVGRTGDAGGKIGRETPLPPPEAPDRVAILSVPFGPAWRKIAQLIAIGTEIPGLGNELEPGHDRILTDCVKECGTLGIFAVLPPQRRAQIKPKAVDMHLGRPI